MAAYPGYIVRPRRLSENGYDLERTISFSDSLPVIKKARFDIHLFDGKTKEKENLSANIEQIGVIVQGRTEERRKSGPNGKTTHGQDQKDAPKITVRFH
jgi:hypothetical protein